MRDFLYRLFRPHFWIMTNRFCREYDELLSHALDSGAVFKLVDNYTATIGGFEIWIATYPYSYGVAYPHPLSGFRPSGYTINRIRRLEVADRMRLLKQKMKPQLVVTK